ncbi:unnamed protein product, partial [Owenia fusiformis]
MTAIKHTLQREVFLPCDERLIGVVHVNKAGKKKKASFLCAAVTTEKPVQVFLYLVKKADKGDTYKKKTSWPLRSLRQFDNKDITKDIADFDIVMPDKTFKWTASNIQEKNSFITCLWKLCQRYLQQKPEFLNVHSSLLEDVTAVGESGSTKKGLEELLPPSEEGYANITAREEKDLESLMKDCEFAISNAEAFGEQLSKDLSILDGANIHSIMSSEEQVHKLMQFIDVALDEATEIEQKLDGYDNLLQSVKDQMEIMKDKDTFIQIKNRNHKELLDELDKLISKLDLDHKHMKSLLDGDLSTPTGIYESTVAAQSLQDCMNVEIHPALSKMQAVVEQQRRFDKLKSTFAKRVSHHLNNLFIHQGNEMETLSRHTQDLKLPQHHSSHRDLLPYAELMLWLKTVENQHYTSLAKVYTTSLSKLYDREIRDFFESAKQKITIHKATESRKTSTFYSVQPSLDGSQGSLNKSTSHKKSSSFNSLDTDSVHGSDLDLTRSKFDSLFNTVLSELEPVCLNEQEFCVRFFHLSTEPQSPDVTLIVEKEYFDEDGQPKKYSPEELQKSNRKLISEEIRKMMGGLFPSLEPSLVDFVEFGYRLDGFNSMYMLVRMSQHVLHAQDTGSFLSKSFASCLISIKRNFDKFIQSQIRSIEDYRVTKKGRCGIIPFVSNFEDFANQAERIFKGSDRRTDLDRSYRTLVHTIFEQIGRVASEHPKTPRSVVMLENFHHMYSMLSQLKIQVLDTERKEAKQKYQENLQAYVTAQLGRPMEKLNLFFDGIENRVAAGVKAEEVGYQLAFNKQELRKVIKEYPGKEVKKGLDNLYKKVEKHLCDEENLAQVVWHSMQDDFIKQYNHFDELIKKCYPGSNVTLEFTMRKNNGFVSSTEVLISR